MRYKRHPDAGEAFVRSFTFGAVRISGKLLIFPLQCRPVLLILAMLGFTGMVQGQVRLTEFLAVNTSGLADEESTPQPWIEIWNSNQTTAATLTNYKLTDGAAVWTFPNVQIMPDGFMVIFASGKNRITATSPLHTNFTLPAAGGSLILQNAAGAVISSLENYPAQQADVSWGRDEWDIAATPVQTGRYSLPTPGGRNNFDGPGVAGRVICDQTSRAYAGTLTVTLSQAAPDPAAQIRYTTNRTVPTEASDLYTGPLAVSTTQMLRARVFQPGRLPGETVTAAYLLLNATTQNFTSTMPVVVLSNFVTSTPPENGDQVSYLWCWEPASVDGLTRLTNPPSVITRTVMDRRGSSTLGNPKLNINLEARNDWNDDEHDVPLLGMAAHSDWVFHAPYDFDRSLIHNPLMYSLSRDMGHYASDARMAEVFIDINSRELNFTGTNSATSDYYGVYNVVEKIRRGNDRVDIRKMEVYDNGEFAKTGGYIWKVDRVDAGDTGFSAGGQTMAYDYPKERDIKSAQRDPQEKYLTGYINSFRTALQGTNWKNPDTGYAAWLDVPVTIDNHLLNIWSFNVDALVLSAFWHKDAGGKMMPGPIWDFDRALSSTDGRDTNPAVWSSGNFFSAVWYSRLFADIDFYQKYIDRWQNLRNGGLFSPDSINARIDAWNAKISTEAITRDLARWRMLKRTWKNPFTLQQLPASQAAEIQRLKDYLQQRANFMDKQWVGPVSSSVPSGPVAAGVEVTLTGPAGTVIYYTLDGSDPRPSGGAAPVAANPVKVWNGTPVKITKTTRLRARAHKAGHTATIGGSNPSLVSKWSGLADFRYFMGEAAAPGKIVVTELNFNPVDPSAAELAVNPAWTNNSYEFIELRNIGAKPVDLSGVRFTAGITFTFPADGTAELAPGGHLIVASDPAAFSTRYPGTAAVFGPWSGNLSNSGETLTLKGPHGKIIQDFTYSDAWAKAADKGGYAMTAYDSLAPPQSFNNSANWRTGFAAGGSPGSYDPNSILLVSSGGQASGPFTSVHLTGSVAGGRAGGALPMVSWSKAEGPGEVTFTTPESPESQAVFSQPGFYRLRLSATGGGVTRMDDLPVYVQHSAASWLAADPALGGLMDDPDHDGRSNLLEFALCTDPLAADFGPAAALEMIDGQPALTFSRLSPPASAACSMEISDDLVTFRTLSPEEVTEEILATDGFTQKVKITATAVTGSQGRRFLRLRVASGAH